MPHQFISIPALLLLLPIALLAQKSQNPVVPESGTVGSGELAAVIRRGSEIARSPYAMEVNCTDEKGIRSFELFPDGVAIWKNQVQIRLSEAIQTGLLLDLLEWGFPDLAPSYGGKAELKKPAAPLRVSCQIGLEIEGLQKSSVQQVDGQQSAQLIGLAGALLDRVEPLVGEGLGAADIHDGLQKLDQGLLAPQSLKLRFVELPPEAEDKAGSILRIAAGAVSRQLYSPGRLLGPQEWTPLGRCHLLELAAAMRQADLASLPANLWSESHFELEVDLLGHGKTILARPFTRLRLKNPGELQNKFDRLVRVLQGFDPSQPASCRE